MNFYHQTFLEKYALPDEHYSYEDYPLAYISKSKNATKEQIDKALSDEHWTVRQTAAQHPNLTKDQLDKALSDEAQFVRAVAAGHPNLTKEQLDKALNDE